MSMRQDILQKVKAVPALPTVAVKVAQLIRDPDFKIGELQRSIEHSPSLAANILRMANSAYYAGPRSIGTIREAIMRLGSETIQDLVLASSVSSLARKPVKGYDLPPGALWEHMVTTALATTNMGNVMKLTLPGYAFTAAILHDIGKIVLGNAIEIDPEPIMSRAFADRISFEQAEREVLGIDHAEVGAELLTQWNLPDELVDVVRYHHDPERLEKPDVVVDVVHVANSLAMMSGMGRGADGLNYRPSDAVVARLGLKIKHMEKVLNDTMIGREDLRAFFGGFEEK